MPEKVKLFKDLFWDISIKLCQFDSSNCPFFHQFTLIASIKSRIIISRLKSCLDNALTLEEKLLPNSTLQGLSPAQELFVPTSVRALSLFLLPKHEYDSTLPQRIIRDLGKLAVVYH